MTLSSPNVLRPGVVLVDNDPRRAGRRVTIEAVHEAMAGFVIVRWVEYRGPHRRLLTIDADKIHDDGKTRKSGFSVVPPAEET